MAKMAVTVALNEKKLILKKVQSKREYAAQNTGRTSVTPDVLEKSGGSEKLMIENFQAISDLNKRYTRISTAIQESNCHNSVDFAEQTMLIADALNWRKDVAPGHLAFLKQVSQQCQQLKSQFERQPQVLKDSEGKQTIIQPVFHIDIAWLQREIERTENMLGELDGKLSLLNATTFVDI